ncbi:hypothetical protein [Candidatus Nanohalobium constans]|uniref:Uncharacterized protein n=1 Tax=Candidatus Nanohalobium constans TaxID=2565781 RepID=A0A5Q0UJ71_9ARCH|nr:hypothetical protein [Candidatus Nanohalobium constans]QGA81005.1 hypothetical protein LC1Nh_1137 [Candidatus Nanohalobium constans]
MRGQISIEFISLLAIALLASSILVSALADRSAQFNRASPQSEALGVAQKVAYTFDYVNSEDNVSKKLVFSPDLQREYNITVGDGLVSADYGEGDANFPTSYQGSLISLNSTQAYLVEDGGATEIEG